MPCKDLDDTTQCVGAIQRGGRTAQDFDALNLRQRNPFQRRRAQGGRAKAHAVNQDDRMIAVRATDEQPGRAARRATGRIFDARFAREQFRQAGLPGGLDVFAADR